MQCFRCKRDVPDSDIKWRNPIRGIAKDENNFIKMANIEYDKPPGQKDPGAAPYCSRCRIEMDKAT